MFLKNVFGKTFIISFHSKADWETLSVTELETNMIWFTDGSIINVRI